MSQASFHRSPTFNASSRIQSPQNDSLASLQTALLKLVSQIEGMNHEFDRIVEKNCKPNARYYLVSCYLNYNFYFPVIFIVLSEKSDNVRNGSTISRPISSIEGIFH